jgi:hypothetical protein
MTQPTSKSEEAVAFLLSVLGERGCIDKEELKRIFTKSFAGWEERTAVVRFYETLRRLKAHGQIYTHGEKICIADQEITQLRSLFCDILPALKYRRVSKSSENFAIWASNGRVLSLIVSKIAELSVYELSTGVKDRRKALVHLVADLPEPPEQKELAAVELATEHALEWFAALKGFLSAGEPPMAFIDDPVKLAYLLSLLMEAESPGACERFRLETKGAVLLTTCRVAADVMTAVLRASKGGKYVLFPMSGRALTAGDPYYAMGFPCEFEEDMTGVQMVTDIFAFGVSDLIPTQRKLKQFFRHVRIVETEDEPCDVCRVMPRSYSA